MVVLIDREQANAFQTFLPERVSHIRALVLASASLSTEIGDIIDRKCGRVNPVKSN